MAQSPGLSSSAPLVDTKSKPDLKTACHPFPRAPQGLRSHSGGVKRARTLTPGCGLCVVGRGSAWPGFPAAWMLLLGFPAYLLSAPAIASRGAHGNMPQGPGAYSPAASQGNLLLSPHLTQEAYL